MPEKKHATLTEAVAAFHADLPKVGKGSLNPAFKSKYADLADIVSVVLPALAKQGLAWLTLPTITEHGFVLSYELRHDSGEHVNGSWPLPDPAAVTPQQLGSAVTYAKRYALSAVTGIAPDEDDDGNAASTGNAAAPRKEKVAAPDGWRGLIAAAVTVAELTAIYQTANAQGWASPDVMSVLGAAKKTLAEAPVLDPADPDYLEPEQ